jgi:hypothetical protein
MMAREEKQAMGLIDTSLEVVKLATKIANPELVQTATKANIEALELSARNLELHKYANDLENRVKELEEKLEVSGEVFREGDFIFREGDPGGHCSRCWDVERKLIHIITMNSGDGRGYNPGCPACKTGTRGRGQNPHMQHSS